MKIITAEERHIDAINKLYVQLNTAMHNLQPDFALEAEQDREFIKSNITGENSDILIAVEGDEVLGMALVQFKTTPPFPSVAYHIYASLMDLVVDEEYRGKGIGTALLDECKVWAKNKGAEFVELNVLAENEGAKKLYEKMGYIDASIRMRCIID